MEIPIDNRQRRLCVVIVSWNVQRDLRACLDSVYSGNVGVDFEVVVIDNASSDGTVEMVRDEFPQVRLIDNDYNAGFAGGNNQGLRVVAADYYLLLNPDTVVPAHAFERLLDFADAHPEAGLVGPKLLNVDGSLQYSARRFPTVSAALFRNTAIGRWFPNASSPGHYLMTDWDHDSARQVDWLSGACLLIRHLALAEVGDLDEGFFWGSEDVDYGFRMHKAGWEVWYTPEPAIVHAIGQSTSQAVLQTIIRTHRSMRRLYAKHLARNPFSRALVSVGIWLRAGVLMVSHMNRAAVARVRFVLLGKRRKHG